MNTITDKEITTAKPLTDRENDIIKTMTEVAEQLDGKWKFIWEKSEDHTHGDLVLNDETVEDRLRLKITVRFNKIYNEREDQVSLSYCLPKYKHNNSGQITFDKRPSISLCYTKGIGKVKNDIQNRLLADCIEIHTKNVETITRTDKMIDGKIELVNRLAKYYNLENPLLVYMLERITSGSSFYFEDSKVDVEIRYDGKICAKFDCDEELLKLLTDTSANYHANKKSTGE